MLKLCKKHGLRFSLIVPTALLTQSSYKTLRKAITDKYHVVAIARLPNEIIFWTGSRRCEESTPMIIVIDDILKNDSSVEMSELCRV